MFYLNIFFINFSIYVYLVLSMFISVFVCGRFKFYYMFLWELIVLVNFILELLDYVVYKIIK